MCAVRTLSSFGPLAAAHSFQLNFVFGWSSFSLPFLLFGVERHAMVRAASALGLFGANRKVVYTTEGNNCWTKCENDVDHSRSPIPGVCSASLLQHFARPSAAVPFSIHSIRLWFSINFLFSASGVHFSALSGGDGHCSHPVLPLTTLTTFVQLQH